MSGLIGGLIGWVDRVSEWVDRGVDRVGELIGWVSVDERVCSRVCQWVY